MAMTLPERVAVVEIKVDTLQQVCESTDAKMTVVYDHIIAEKTKKKLINKGLIAIGGFVTFLGTVWSLLPHK